MTKNKTDVICERICIHNNNKDGKCNLDMIHIKNTRYNFCDEYIPDREREKKMFRLHDSERRNKKPNQDYKKRDDAIISCYKELSEILNRPPQGNWLEK